MKITKDSKIFTIGSCFAVEIQSYLASKGFNVLNRAIERNPAEPSLIWYNTFTILYEFWRLTGAFIQKQTEIWETSRGFQDPYRRMVFAPTADALWNKIIKLDTQIAQCIREADIFIITLGLTEVFFMNNGRAICAVPGYGGGGGQDCKFRATTFPENWNNMCNALIVIAGRPVIVTVSPVPLAKTFTKESVAVANSASKSILRAVTADMRKYENVFYLPSYEMAVESKDVYKEDKRHVTPAFVSKVMERFENTFC